MGTLLMSLASLAIRVIPVERLAAMGINALIARIDSGKVRQVEKAIERVAVLSRHLSELSELATHMLEDRQMSADEIGLARQQIKSARDDLMKAWATGSADGKARQKELGGMAVDAAYAERHDAME